MSTTTERIKLLLVDDHPVVRRGISICLARHPRYQVVGEASDGCEAITQAKALCPDVILMDLNMPNVDGIEATRLLQREVPTAKVLTLSVQNDRASILQIVRSGARGYILKDAPVEELLSAIDAVYQGDAFFSPDVARLLLNQYVQESSGTEENRTLKLTPRELEVLTRIADGESNKEVANKLNVSVRTVEAHRERIMRKLNVHSVVGLTKYAIAQGLIRIEKASAL